MHYSIRPPQSNYYTYQTTTPIPTSKDDPTHISFDEYKERILTFIEQFESPTTNVHTQYYLLQTIKYLMEEKKASESNWNYPEQEKANKLEADVKAVLATETMHIPIPIGYDKNGSPDSYEPGTLCGDVDHPFNARLTTFKGADGKTYKCYLGILKDASGKPITALDVLNNLGNPDQIFHSNFEFFPLDRQTNFGNNLGWQYDSSTHTAEIKSTDIYGREDQKASDNDRIHIVTKGDKYHGDPLYCQVTGNAEALSRQCLATKSDGFNEAIGTLILDYYS